MRFSARALTGIVVGALVVLSRLGGAQMPIAADAGRANATRQELERIAADAESAASVAVAGQQLRESKLRAAAAIRERLREGDFHPGDRIVLAIQGDLSLNDTVVVRPGPALSVLSLPDDSLRGVLRSELQSHLATWVTHYYKNARVRATPLIRLGVLGEVNHPGYYRVPVDISVSDAIMTAGGPTQRAEMPRTVVRRRSSELLSKAAVRDAIAVGSTLEQLGLDAGDELLLSAKKERSWMNIVQIASLATGVVLSLNLSRRF
ncbi:MAG TPA: SLBB domain-containing protein [Gemmatimonadaceae bacterium]